MYSELNKTLTHIVAKVDSTQLIQLLSELSSLYIQVINDSTPETNQKIIEIHNKVEEAQLGIEPQHFDIQSLRTFRKFDSEQVLGRAGVDNLESKLAGIKNNPRAVATAIQEFSSLVNSVRDRAQKALTNLEEIFEGSEEIPPDEGSLQIVFEGNVSVETFKDLTAQGKFWYTIIELTKQIVPTTSEGEVVITSIYKSSPATITIRGKILYLYLIAQCFMGALNIKGALLDHEKLKSEIRLNNITAEEKELMLAALKKSEEKTLQSKIEEATKAIMEQNKNNLGLGVEKNSATSSCRLIVKKLYNFSVSGGHVSIVENSEDSHGQEEIYNLEARYQELKRIKENLKVEVLPEAKFSSEEQNKLNDEEEKPEENTNTKNKSTQKDK